MKFGQFLVILVKLVHFHSNLVDFRPFWSFFCHYPVSLNDFWLFWSNLGTVWSFWKMKSDDFWSSRLNFSNFSCFYDENVSICGHFLSFSSEICRVFGHFWSSRLNFSDFSWLDDGNESILVHFQSVPVIFWIKSHPFLVIWDTFLIHNQWKLAEFLPPIAQMNDSVEKRPKTQLKTNENLNIPTHFWQKNWNFQPFQVVTLIIIRFFSLCKSPRGFYLLHFLLFLI